MQIKKKKHQILLTVSITGNSSTKQEYGAGNRISRLWIFITFFSIYKKVPIPLAARGNATIHLLRLWVRITQGDGYLRVVR